MIENTLENKEKFFAAYFGQKVIIGKYTVNGYLIDWLNSDDYMELLPLSSITDEDAIELCKIVFKNTDNHSVIMGYRILSGMGLVTHFKSGQRIMITSNPDNSFCVADFLRSKSYLLPWMGLTPDEIINFGWAKYKEV